MGRVMPEMHQRQANFLRRVAREGACYTFSMRTKTSYRWGAAIVGLGLALLLQGAPACAQASISIEVVTEQGVQITAPSEWLQLLARIGQREVRIRSIQPGDAPRVEEGGTSDHPRYRVTALLTAGDVLQVPGGSFTRRDSAGLKDYFERLAADGPSRLTAQKGRFGLTEKEFDSVFQELSRPLAVPTEGVPLAKFIDQVKGRAKLPLAIDPAAEGALHKSAALKDDLQSLTLGTSLAIALRSADLVLLPHKERGKEVGLRIARSQDVKEEAWPVGWKSEATPRQLAPKLFETLNAEVEGFTLEEAMAAMAPRIGVPIYWDHATLAKHKIDPGEVQVRLPRSRTHLKRVVDQLLFQGRVMGELRVDEGGTGFYWISR